MVRFLIILVVILLAGGRVSAGWITITNNTTQQLIIQETITVNGQARKCKPVKLAPGEILREFQQTGGTKKLTLSESGLLGRQLFTGEVTWKDDAAFSIHKDGDKFKMSETKPMAAKVPEAPAAPAEKKPR